MKRVLSILVCAVLLLAATISASAAETETAAGTLISRTEKVLENGLTVVETIYDLSQARSTDKTAHKTQEFYSGDTLIAVITIQGTFRYDGSTVSVVSKSVTQTDTYDGWSYKQNSFTSSGGTVTLDAKLTKWLILNTSFTTTLTCDKNGNIS